MDQNLPGLIVSGASGFIGRHVVAAFAGKYRLFCLARRSQSEAGIPVYDNQRWTQVDISDWNALQDIVRCVTEHGGAEYVLHLAGYYDFTNNDHPQYEATNVHGTRNMLEMARLLNIKHFIFVSSLAACPFPDPLRPITEETQPDAKFPYAESKRRAEGVVREYSQWFDCAILRLAAIFSDWCEYPPVYMFLTTWLSQKWNRRILGGRGESAVPYLHINDLIKLFNRVLQLPAEGKRCAIYNASPSATISHKELYLAATRFFYGHEYKPVHFPKWPALLGVAIRQWIGSLLGQPPFERIWMMQYIDKKLTVDAHKTYQALNWQPTPRYNLNRRLLIIIENLKSNPEAWHLKNEAAIERVSIRANLAISSCLIEMRKNLIHQIAEFIGAKENAERFCHYHLMPKETLRWFVSLFYQILVTSIRTRNRSPLRSYARIIAFHRFKQGFRARPVCDMVLTMGRIISEHLLVHPAMQAHKQHVYDYVTLSLQLAADEIEEAFEQLAEEIIPTQIETNIADLLNNDQELKRMVQELEDICKDGWNTDLFFSKKMPNDTIGPPR